MNITALIAYIAVMSITPGPNNLMSLYLGAKGGLRSYLPFISGSMTGLFVKTVLCGLLNLALAEKIPTLVPYLKWVGFAYMLYLAYSMIAGALKNKDGGDAGQTGEATFYGGVLLQVLNIKSWVAALSIFSVYVIPYTTDVGIMLLVAVGFTLVCIGCSFLWFACGTVLQGLYKKYRLPVSCIFAATLVLCAISAIK